MSLAVARAAQTAGCQRLAVVSALEANAQSPVFYSRVKGEMEQGLIAMGFKRLVLARPSIIDGDRAALYSRLKLSGMAEAPVHLAVFCDDATPKGHGLGAVHDVRLGGQQLGDARGCGLGPLDLRDQHAKDK